jgi:hypothetical protein
MNIFNTTGSSLAAAVVPLVPAALVVEAAVVCPLGFCSFLPQPINIEEISTAATANDNSLINLLFFMN